MEFTFLEFLKYDYPSVLLVLGLIVLMISNRKNKTSSDGEILSISGSFYALDNLDHYGAVAVCGICVQMVGERPVAFGYPVLDDDNQISDLSHDTDDADNGVGR